MAPARHSFEERYIFFTSALLLTLSIIAGLLVVERAENKRFLETQRQSVVEKASTIRVRLEGSLNADLLLAQSLIIEVATNKDISKDRTRLQKDPVTMACGSASHRRAQDRGGGPFESGAGWDRHYWSHAHIH
jgi:sensor domain CHASE-containing protein